MSDKTFNLNRLLTSDDLSQYPEGTVLYSEHDLFYLRQDDGSWTVYGYMRSDAPPPKRGDLVGIIDWDN